jgi:hypothetical protein
MTMRPTQHLLACAALVAAIAASGCTTTNSTRAKSLKGATGSAASLADCEHITVLPFTLPAKRSKDAAVGVQFADGIRTRLGSDFGPLFKSVESGTQARGLDHECLVRGDITKYKPGSRAARFILIGLGAASLEGNITVSDAAGGAELMRAPFDKLWAWGGIAGASKGMKDMVAETSASASATIAHGKGWNPPAK